MNNAFVSQSAEVIRRWYFESHINRKVLRTYIFGKIIAALFYEHQAGPFIIEMAFLNTETNAATVVALGSYVRISISFVIVPSFF